MCVQGILENPTIHELQSHWEIIQIQMTRHLAFGEKHSFLLGSNPSSFLKTIPLY